MKYIVSLTSHGKRVKYITTALAGILYKNSDFKVVLTLHEDDIKYMPLWLWSRVKDGTIELIPANVDLGPHLKYFYSMQKYRHLPVITIDDDCLISPNRLNLLYNGYKSNPRDINALRVHKIEFNDNGEVKPYNSWSMEYKFRKTPSHDLLATGVGGVIYPPDVFELSKNNINEILTCKYADDIYLKVLEIRKGIKVHWIENSQVHPNQLHVEEVRDMALMKVNNTGRNDTYIKKFMTDFNRLFTLK